ncbi:MAG: thioredoxin family protein [Calditrichales bacterium]|nr:MAG: thioredoxin family protein [Calditrichales bacterium]
MYFLKKVLLLIIAINLINACGCQENSYVPVLTFDPQRDAALDLQNAIKEAQRSNRYIIIDVGGEWCIWCHKLDQFFETHKAIAEFMHENYVVLKINFSKENINEAVLSNFPPIQGYPHLFVLDQQGQLLHSQDSGLLESGDQHDVEKVRVFLENWAPGGSNK